MKSLNVFLVVLISIVGCGRKTTLMSIDQLPRKDHSVFIIERNFDLKGKTITLPPSCKLIFKGGSLSNGTIKMINTDFSGLSTNVFKSICFEGTTVVKNINASYFGLIKDKKENQQII